MEKLGSTTPVSLYMHALTYLLIGTVWTQPKWKRVLPAVRAGSQVLVWCGSLSDNNKPFSPNFPVIMKPQALEEACAICAIPAIQKCGACKLVFYCSKEHQKKHWKTHSKKCKAFKVCKKFYVVSVANNLDAVI